MEKKRIGKTFCKFWLQGTYVQETGCLTNYTQANNNNKTM